VHGALNPHHPMQTARTTLKLSTLHPRLMKPILKSMIGTLATADWLPVNACTRVTR